MSDKATTVIVGAGPAGLYCSYLLAKEGVDVIVLEQNSQVGLKSCAGGLSCKTLALLSPPETLLEKSFNSLRVHFNHRSLWLNDWKTLVATVSRPRLEHWLLDLAQEAGARVFWREKVTRIIPPQVETEHQRFTFDFLVGADGSHSQVRHFLKLPTLRYTVTYQAELPQEREHLEWFYDYGDFGPGYGWIFPHQGFTAVGCGSAPDQMSPSALRQRFLFWLSRLGIKPESLKTNCTVINLDFRDLRFDRFFLIGDAAGAASPATGEGIYGALLTAREVARFILNPRYDWHGLEQLNRWLKRHQLVARLLLLSPLTAKLLHRSMPLFLKLSSLRRTLLTLAIK